MSAILQVNNVTLVLMMILFLSVCNNSDPSSVTDGLKLEKEPLRFGQFRCSTNGFLYCPSGTLVEHTWVGHTKVETFRTVRRGKFPLMYSRQQLYITFTLKLTSSDSGFLRDSLKLRVA